MSDDENDDIEVPEEAAEDLEPVEAEADAVKGGKVFDK
jgi:hypothetical protein